MKKVFIAMLCLVGMIACSKKTIPVSTTNAHVDTSRAIVVNNTPADTAATSVTANGTSTNAGSAASVMVVSDGYGKIINSQKNLPPESDIKFDYLQLSRGFTPQQRANLKTRYKTIPPRVLYVAPPSQLSSGRGMYYIYMKKFWYWEKKDGLFYLDEKYYL